MIRPLHLDEMHALLKERSDEIIKLQGKLKKVEDYCSDILSGYPPSGDQDFVAQGVIDIIQNAGESK